MRILTKMSAQGDTEGAGDDEDAEDAGDAGDAYQGGDASDIQNAPAPNTRKTASPVRC